MFVRLSRLSAGEEMEGLIDNHSILPHIVYAQCTNAFLAFGREGLLHYISHTYTLW